MTAKENWVSLLLPKLLTKAEVEAWVAVGLSYYQKSNPHDQMDARSMSQTFATVAMPMVMKM